MKTGIFFKKGSNSDFCGTEILPNGEDIPRIVIKSIDFHENLKVGGRPEHDRWTMTFDPNPFTEKRLLANVTNRKRIAKAHWNDVMPDGTICAGRINLLENIAVRLTAEVTRDPQDGSDTLGLRISKYAPASEEEMNKWLVEHGYTASTPQKKTITEDKIQVTVDWAKGKRMTFEQVADMFNFESEAVKDAFIDAMSNNDLPE